VIKELDGLVSSKLKVAEMLDAPEKMPSPIDKNVGRDIVEVKSNEGNISSPW